MDYVFIVVGVGGTGSLFARDLPKLLIGTNHQIVLVDGDVVEKKNMKRQSYQDQDVGMKKAIALSKKINTFYLVDCEALGQYVTQDELLILIQRYKGYIPILIGCVDNNKTRILLEKTFNALEDVIYIDSANSEFDGNIYCAVRSHGEQQGAVRGQTYKFELDHHPTEKSCQEESAKGNTQFLLTNLKMAVALIEHTHAILTQQIKIGVTTIGRFEEIHYS